MSKRKSWIMILVVASVIAFFVFGGGHALWHALLRMHGMH